MKIFYNETENAAVRVELSLHDLQMMRRVTQYAIDKGGAPNGASNIAQTLDRALYSLAEDMRRTADRILDR